MTSLAEFGVCGEIGLGVLRRPFSTASRLLYLFGNSLDAPRDTVGMSDDRSGIVSKTLTGDSTTRTRLNNRCYGGFRDSHEKG